MKNALIITEKEITPEYLDSACDKKVGIIDFAETAAEAMRKIAKYQYDYLVFDNAKRWGKELVRKIIKEVKSLFVPDESLYVVEQDFAGRTVLIKLLPL